MKQAWFLHFCIRTRVGTCKVDVRGRQRFKRFVSGCDDAGPAVRQCVRFALTHRISARGRLADSEHDTQRRPAVRSKIGISGLTAGRPPDSSALPPAESEAIIGAVENIPVWRRLLADPSPERLVGKPLRRATGASRLVTLRDSRICAGHCSARIAGLGARQARGRRPRRDAIGTHDGPAHGIFALIASDDPVRSQRVKRERIG